MTTGQAARQCSVTSDTVLKWIRSGRLPARKTVGGHHRIDEKDLSRVLSPARRSGVAVDAAPDPRVFRYCWEFNGNGELMAGCRECLVYELRAHRCYEVAKMGPMNGHSKLFCKRSCLECDYYRSVHGQAINVLVVTDDASLTESLERDVRFAPFNLRVTDCEYRCSALVEVFRPDFVLIDCSLGTEKSKDICLHLMGDPRIPFVRVIMAVGDDGVPSACNKEVFARMRKPLGITEIAECIRSASGDGENLRSIEGSTEEAG